MRRSVLLFLALAGIIPAAAQETDIIYFTNGDRLTCEVKRLRRGVLQVSVEAVDGDLRIDWKRVSRIESDRVFEFRLSDGQQHIGEIRKSEDEGESEEILVVSGTGETKLRFENVIDVRPLYEGLGGSLEVEADGGFSFTRSNNQTQYTANVQFDYTTPRYSIKSTVNSLFSGQRDGANTNRHSFTGRYIKFVRSHWSVHTFADFLISDQQKLALRSTVGTGVAREIRQTQRFYLGIMGGVAWTNENYTEAANVGVQNSAEALLGLSMGAFSFKKLNLESTFWLFPGLSKGGRMRTDWRNSLKIDLPYDLFWRFGLTLNLDNNPPPGVSGNDLVTTTTVGWEF